MDSFFRYHEISRVGLIDRGKVKADQSSDHGDQKDAGDQSH